MRAIFRSEDMKVKVLIETRWFKWKKKKSKYIKFDAIMTFHNYCKRFAKKNGLRLHHFSDQSRKPFMIPKEYYEKNK